MWKAVILLTVAALAYGQDDPRLYRYNRYVPRYRHPSVYRRTVPDVDTAGRINYVEDETPKPYSFSYTAPEEGGVGSSSRTEVADGNGRVEGSYTLTNGEGHTRIVDYVSDEGGFRATVRTDEPGTGNQSPAHINFLSTAPNVFSSNIEHRPELRNPVYHRHPAAYRVAPAVAEEPASADQPIDQPLAERPRTYRPHYYNGRQPYYATPYRNYDGYRRDAYYPY